ncbi:MAG: alpha/beta hydrolase [Geobacteraceae bacterium]|nr:alpha/beta hydrolase [Geobacteraceae bacterium]
MNVLFVHGMGRSSLSWAPTLIRFRSRGIKPFVFGYSVARQDFSAIVRRLVKVLMDVSKLGDYALVGHSLGGVLLRAALHELPAKTLPPKQLFLLGSPVVSSRLARQLSKNRLFRAVTCDCGHLLGSDERMSSIPEAHVPTVAIAGIRGVHGRLSPFGSEPNDGIVSLEEVSAGGFAEVLQVPVVHTFLPSSKCVADIILDRVLDINS